MKNLYYPPCCEAYPVARAGVLCSSIIQGNDSISDYENNTPTGWEFDD